jgi:hypothetical protein
MRTEHFMRESFNLGIQSAWKMFTLEDHMIWAEFMWNADD